VEDPSGVVLFEESAKEKGTFAFTTKKAGDYKTCFTAKGQTAERTFIVPY
jgi:hypothetical protein